MRPAKHLCDALSCLQIPPGFSSSNVTLALSLRSFLEFELTGNVDFLRLINCRKGVIILIIELEMVHCFV